jgi:hypothetical protein
MSGTVRQGSASTPINASKGVIRLIFARFAQHGSARQVLLSLQADQVHFRRPSDRGGGIAPVWDMIRYRNVISVLTNPFYAGVYVYGKSSKRTAIVDGRARRSYGHGKPVADWDVVIQDHYEGYWPAAGFVDTEIGCFMKREVAYAATEVWA